MLAAHPTVGHTQALRALGKRLLARGHQVDFAIPHVPQVPSWLPTPQALQAARRVVAGVQEDGFGWVRTRFSWRAGLAAARIEGRRGYDELTLATQLFTAGIVDTARTLAKHCRQNDTELVIHDFTFFGGWLAAESVGVPSVAVFHSGLPFPAPGAPPFGSGLDATASTRERRKAERCLDKISGLFDRKVNDARNAMALPAEACRLLTRPYSRTLNVLTTHEAFELPRPDLHEQAAGPLLWAGVCAGARHEDVDGFPWSRLTTTAPLVYISLGTVFNDQPRLFDLLLAAVHRAGASAVVAAGAAFDHVKRRAGAGDIVVKYAPQLALLERVDLVVGHGGNNSTNETLQAGKPLLVLPFGAEQIANGQRVEALGVGRLLRTRDLNVERLAGIVGEFLGEEMRQRAQALARSVPADDGAESLANAIEGLSLAAGSARR